jgi:excisionase family DNA binding protein
MQYSGRSNRQQGGWRTALHGDDRDVTEGPRGEDEFLSAEEVANALGVEPVTVYRWCRQGRLTCLKPGKSWRIRRTALDTFLRNSERPQTLTAQLGAFLQVPDQVLGVAQDADLLTRLDAAFFKAGEARGGLLVKLYDPKQTARRVLMATFQRHGLDAGRLEAAGRLRWCPVTEPEEVISVLQQVLADEARSERLVWAGVDWEDGIPLDAALRQQAALAQLVKAYPLVVTTMVIEPEAGTWPSAQQQWQLLGTLRGVVRFARAGLMLSRVVPPPAQ